MNIKNIIYYTVKNDTKQTVSLRSLCIKEEYNKGLETIFYATRDAINAQDLLETFKRICHEQIEFESETDKFILFTVIDAYDNINYLKFEKIKSKYPTI